MRVSIRGSGQGYAVAEEQIGDPGQHAPDVSKKITERPALSRPFAFEPGPE